MKKSFLSVFTAVAVSGTSAFAATSQPSAYIPYLGIDYGYVEAKAQKLKPYYNSFILNLGTKYNPYFGTEIFYQQTSSDSKKFAEGKFKSSYRAYGLDIAAYLPLGCYHTADLIATGGIGEYVFKKKFSGGKHHNDSGWGYRVGGGIAYNFSENVSLRLLARYVGLDKVSDFNHLMEYSAGIRYYL